MRTVRRTGASMSPLDRGVYVSLLGHGLYVYMPVSVHYVSPVGRGVYAYMPGTCSNHYPFLDLRDKNMSNVDDDFTESATRTSPRCWGKGCMCPMKGVIRHARTMVILALPHALPTSYSAAVYRCLIRLYSPTLCGCCKWETHNI